MCSGRDCDRQRESIRGGQAETIALFAFEVRSPPMDWDKYPSGAGTGSAPHHPVIDVSHPLPPLILLITEPPGGAALPPAVRCPSSDRASDALRPQLSGR